MNTVKLSSLALLGALTLVACKEAPQEIQESETQSVINEQLAMTEDFKESVRRWKKSKRPISTSQPARD